MKTKQPVILYKQTTFWDHGCSAGSVRIPRNCRRTKGNCGGWSWLHHTFLRLTTLWSLTQQWECSSMSEWTVELIKHPMVAVGNLVPKFKCYGGGEWFIVKFHFLFFPFPTPTSGKMNTYSLYLGQDINLATALHTSMFGCSVSYDPLKHLVWQEHLPLIESPPFHTRSGNVSKSTRKMLNIGSKSYTDRQGGRHEPIACDRVFFFKKKQWNDS